MVQLHFRSLAEGGGIEPRWLLRAWCGGPGRRSRVSPSVHVAAAAHLPRGPVAISHRFSKMIKEIVGQMIEKLGKETKDEGMKE